MAKKWCRVVHSSKGCMSTCAKVCPSVELFVTVHKQSNIFEVYNFIGYDCDVVGDPRGSPVAGECFSDSSIANTIRVGNQEVDYRAKGQEIL